MTEMPKVLLPNVDDSKGDLCFDEDRLAQLRWAINIFNNPDLEDWKKIQTVGEAFYDELKQNNKGLQ